MRQILLRASLPAIVVSCVFAAGPAATKAADSNVTSATYALSGLHCPGCGPTIENSLKKTKGVQEISVNFDSKNAHVKFDESQLSAQQLANAIAATPHMMGANLRYGGSLVLNVPDVKDAASAAKAKAALSKLPGVAQATANPDQHTLTVQFAAQGKTTSQQLFDALKQAGMNATND